jgi:hypothetical protein
VIGCVLTLSLYIGKLALGWLWCLFAARGEWIQKIVIGVVIVQATLYCLILLGLLRPRHVSQVQSPTSYTLRMDGLSNPRNMEWLL